MQSYLAGGFGFGDLMEVRPGESEFTIPVSREGFVLPGDRYQLPPPGKVSFDVLAPNVETDASDPTPLDPVLSVIHDMPHTADGRDAAEVSFVGGYKCQYYIQDHWLECADPFNGEDNFHTGLAYSGYFETGVDATCINNACAQCYKQVWRNEAGKIVEAHGGPIPVGSYDIGQGFLDPERPMMSYRLTPRDVPCKSRSGMMIHFGTLSPGEVSRGGWSEGCVVVPAEKLADGTFDNSLRDQINRYGGGTLDVFARKDDRNDYLKLCKVPTYGEGWIGVEGALCAGLGP
jgi:hypothetical protein